MATSDKIGVALEVMMYMTKPPEGGDVQSKIIVVLLTMSSTKWRLRIVITSRLMTAYVRTTDSFNICRTPFAMLKL